jgi:hypothetical protein
MTQAFGSESAKFTIVLPGTWANIPLHDPAETERAVRALVKKQVGRDDRFARVRRDAKNQLMELAENASATSILGLSLWLELVPGMPFPGSLTVDVVERPDDSAESALPAEADELALFLERLFPEATVLDAGPGPTARTAYVTSVRAGENDIPHLKITYVVPDPGAQRMLRFLVDLPTVDRTENYVDLFDLVIDSVRLTSAETAAEASAETPAEASAASALTPGTAEPAEPMNDSATADKVAL